MKERLSLWWQSLLNRARLMLAKRIVWLADERRDQLGQRTSLPAIVGVIGREFYEERRRTYPIRGYFELDRVLSLEPIKSRSQLTFVGPIREDHREVIFFDLDERFDPNALNALFWVPETFLVARMLPRESLASIDRAGLCYFIADSGLNMVRGGAVRSPDLFGFAVGISAGRDPIFWSGEDLRNNFLVALRRIPLSGWLRFASPDIAGKFQKHWRPAAIGAAVVLAGYLILGSTYLLVVGQLRQRELLNLGSEVASLIEKQRTAERLSLRQAAIVNLCAEQQPTYLLWGLAADVISAGGTFSGLYFNNGEMTVRGRAKVATSILAKLASRKDVVNARFATPVRPAGDLEEFAISLKLSSRPLVKSGAK